MKVAVLTLTRDRLEYTQHCFQSLAENAGCDYDHFVLDQNSEDETLEWLMYDAAVEVVVGAPENMGISRGFNRLLDLLDEWGRYDVVATMDNDCELFMPGTLYACALIAAPGDWIVSPTVLGLNNPPQPSPPVVVGGELIGPYRDIGGIFRVMPGKFARTFRFNEQNPLWGYDERDCGREAARRGINVGYLLNWSVNHYETTTGQHSRYPDYFARTLAEGKPHL